MHNIYHTLSNIKRFTFWSILIYFSMTINLGLNGQFLIWLGFILGIWESAESIWKFSIIKSYGRIATIISAIMFFMVLYFFHKNTYSYTGNINSLALWGTKICVLFLIVLLFYTTFSKKK